MLNIETSPCLITCCQLSVYLSVNFKQVWCKFQFNESLGTKWFKFNFFKQIKERCMVIQNKLPYFHGFFLNQGVHIGKALLITSLLNLASDITNGTLHAWFKYLQYNYHVVIRIYYGGVFGIATQFFMH